MIRPPSVWGRGRLILTTTEPVVVEVRHLLRRRPRRERAMGGGGGDGVEDLAVCGPPAHEVIPDNPFPKLTPPSCARHQAATGIWNTARMPTGSKLERRCSTGSEPRLAGPAFLSSPTGEAARIYRWAFQRFPGVRTGGAHPGSGLCSLLGRIRLSRQAGCHQATRGEIPISLDALALHRILLCWASFAGGKRKLAGPMPNN